MQNLAYQAAVIYLRAGLSFLPIKLGGDKSPAIAEWTSLKSRLPTADEINEWFKQERGIAIIGGKVSGGLECIDFECTQALEDWKVLLEQQQPGLFSKLVVTETPGGKFEGSGWHVRYRVDGDCLGNAKLALTEDGKLLIELKGEGGYALAPGSSPKAHKRGKVYSNVQGKISELSTVTSDQRDCMISLAISLNKKEEKEPEYKTGNYAGGGDSDLPGDKYNQQGDFSILQDHGWKLIGGCDGKHYWRRPGKDHGISATSGYCKGKDGTPRLYVFSTSTVFKDNKYISPFAAYAILKHNGDFSKAASELAGEAKSPRLTIGSPPAEVIAADGEIKSQKPADEREFFPSGVFPDKLQQFMYELSEVLPCPIDTVGTVLLAMASLGVGNSRKIQLKKTWSESACLYVAVVAQPGEGKTPVMTQMNKAVHHWQEALTASYESAKQDFADQLEAWEAAKDSGTAGPKPIKPKYPHVYTTDATTEKLASILSDNPRGIAMDQDELTALVNGMNQYKAGGQGRDRQFYLEAWAGRMLKVDRLSSDEPKMVYNPFLTIFGGIQPQMLGVLKDEFGREDGFVHRFLFCYPPRRILKPWNTDEVSDHSLQAWENCFQKLTTLSLAFNENGKLRPWFCRMTPEAFEQWKAGYDALLPTVNSLSVQFGGAYHKIVAYAARLSLIMQMLYWACDEEPDNQWIGTRAVKAGWKLAGYYASHMRAVYTQIHDKPEDMKAKEYISWIISRGGKVTTREAMQYGPSWSRKKTTIIKMFKDLEDRGLGKAYESPKQDNGKTYYWFEAKGMEVSHDK